VLKWKIEKKRHISTINRQTDQKSTWELKDTERLELSDHTKLSVGSLPPEKINIDQIKWGEHEPTRESTEKTG